jgi:hypothetical protein
MYPGEHKEIVENLLDGEFILYSDKLFMILQENRGFHEEFFLRSFDYNLEMRSEYIFLSSKGTTEKDSRDFTIFLALLCRELELEGKKFREQIDFVTHNIDDVWQMLNNSSKKEIIDTIWKKGKEDYRNFLNRWNRKNVIALTGNSFKFTKAVNLFFEFAVNIANEKLKETNSLQSHTSEQ